MYTSLFTMELTTTFFWPLELVTSIRGWSKVVDVTITSELVLVNTAVPRVELSLLYAKSGKFNKKKKIAKNVIKILI